MGTNKHQRQEIEDMENLAGGLDFVDRLLERLAEATRHHYTLEQLADGRDRVRQMQEIVFRRRRALTEAARAPRRAAPAPDQEQERNQANDEQSDETPES